MLRHSFLRLRKTLSAFPVKQEVPETEQRSSELEQGSSELEQRISDLERG